MAIEYDYTQMEEVKEPPLGPWLNARVEQADFNIKEENGARWFKVQLSLPDYPGSSRVFGTIFIPDPKFGDAEKFQGKLQKFLRLMSGLGVQLKRGMPEDDIAKALIGKACRVKLEENERGYAEAAAFSAPRSQGSVSGAGEAAQEPDPKPEAGAGAGASPRNQGNQGGVFKRPVGFGGGSAKSQPAGGVAPSGPRGFGGFKKPEVRS